MARQGSVLTIVSCNPGILLEDLAAAKTMPTSKLLKRLVPLEERHLVVVLRQGRRQRCFPTEDSRELRHWRLLVQCTSLRATTVHLWIRNYGLTPRAAVIDAMQRQHGWKPELTAKVLRSLLDRRLIAERMEDGRVVLVARILPHNDEARREIARALERFSNRPLADKRPRRRPNVIPVKPPNPGDLP